MKFKGLTLDKFQADAITAIENNKSVVVSAPTGSGKTLIADYIVKRDLEQYKRVVYTAPIKALSNQKFFDFGEDYGQENVGLLTGDTVINPTAPILIMTTEVYRNMVVVGDPLVHEVSYVIFDEIHFISDIDRGTVWEESLIFSPEHIRFLCLSATIPNAQEFANWIRSIKNHKVLVVEHRKRPVPLEKKFYDQDLGITTLAEIHDRVELDRFPQYKSFYKKPKKVRVTPPKHRDLVMILNQKDLLPSIFFAFSRRDTQNKAEELAKSQNFLSVKESRESIHFIQQYFGTLDPQLQRLHSTRLLRQLLPKGIGFHHAGLLPALKHLVEKLFGKRLIKVLYATETFAVGINMPAKTVCFASLRKFDGREFRYLTSKEYFQLAGRAGRRGIDKKGLAVAMINRQFDDIKRVRAFTSRDTAAIKSQFKLSYNTVLNLIARHDKSTIDRILASSFYTFQRGQKEVVSRRFDNLSKRLEKMQYLKKGSITEKGEFLLNIFVDELLIGEVFGTSFWQGLTEYQVLLLIAALVFEPRSSLQFAPPQLTKPAKEVLSRIKQDPFLKRQTKLKNIVTLTGIMLPIFQGEKFTQILKYTNWLEGDLLRFLRQIIDRLNQIKKATQEPALAQIMQNCAHVIDNCLEGIDVV
ncbi:DEAD/DEAH box helicase [Candidatus Woesearchaeota archaeon]|nr:DEAD/DEAH box helicase [Candidatus Woesearchaeota archaeon]